VPKWRDVALLGLIAFLLVGATVTRPGSAIRLTTLTLTDSLLLADGSVVAPSMAFANEPGLGWFRRSAATLTLAIGGAREVELSAGSVEMKSTTLLSWSATADAAGSPDTILLRAAANTLALRNVNAAQVFYLGSTGSSGSSFQIDNLTGLTATITVRDGGGAGDCNLVVTGGIITSTTC